MPIHLRDRIFALVTLALCTSGWLYATTLPASAALFPKLIFAGTSLLALLLLAGSIVGKQQRQAEPFVSNGRRLILTILLSVAYFAAVARLGYFTASLAYIIGLSLTLGERRPAVVLPTALGFVAFVYFIFVIFFNRPLPAEFFQR